LGAKILAFAGSSREGSFSQMLLSYTVEQVRGYGGEVTEVDLRALDLPIYDGDIERDRGLPPGAVHFRNLMKQHPALLIGVTEYNGGVTPLLKNAIDWASRPHDGEPSLSAIRGKVVGMVSCSAGLLGGSRAQAHLRQSFQVMGCLLVPETVTVPHATGAFEEGRPTDAGVRDFVQIVARRLVDTATRLAP
jgi:NAD(P)H-dependent FMN reductase